ncbi:hypothetical protein K3152_00205 [Qipengyuania sp. 1NDH17]|uniref:PD(D/E)XK endonuclease domain-containing protein n=1 Tax=Qipengyuania polymorpha TaxID=2867234 RepID=A0ABS7IU43_9SPHN|nr:hypothetical protein [Qipengyuania polymorpha]MBX7456658.1 hypothetical protein [Qipengyuania polymorpha]
MSEYERLYCGHGAFPQPPNFISQQDEADRGYDVEATLANGRLLLIQLKRSFVLTQHRDAPAILIKPSYRMHLRKNRNYDQHRQLRARQHEGFEVFYVTSRARSRSAVVSAYRSGTLISDRTAAFAPLDIPQPTDAEQHWISFEEHGSYGWMFSKMPTKLEKGQIDLHKHLSFLQQESNTLEANVEALRGLLDSEIGIRRRKQIKEASPFRLFSEAAFAVMETMDARLLIVPDAGAKS